MDDIRPLSDEIRSLIELAVREDLGDLPDGAEKVAARLDRTVALSIPPNLLATGRIVARREGVISGIALMAEILSHYDLGLKSSVLISDGGRAEEDAVVAEISGPAGALLSAGKIQAILDKSMALTIIRPDNDHGESPESHRIEHGISM